MIDTLPLQMARVDALAIATAFTILATHWTSENEHELLLQEHIIELKTLFEMKAYRANKRCTVRLTRSQAVAFCQLWHANHEVLKGYERKVIVETNAAIDQYRKSIQPFYEREKEQTPFPESRRIT